MRNNPYQEERRFKNVFIDKDSYLNNTKPHLIAPLNIDDTNLDTIIYSIYDLLSLEYDNSFFKFARRGTILAENAIFVSTILPFFERLNLLNDNRIKLERGELNYNETSNFATDNTPSSNIEGFQVDKSISKGSSYFEWDSLNKAVLRLRQQINTEIHRYQKLLLNNQYYERGTYYES